MQVTKQKPQMKIQEIGTTPLRNNGGSIEVRKGLKDALEAAGIDPTGGLEYIPDRETGMLIAVEADGDGRSSPNVRSIHPEGDGYGVGFPKDLLDVVGLDDVELDGRTGFVGPVPRVTIYAGDGMVAFERAGEKEIDVDALRDDQDDDDGGA